RRRRPARRCSAGRSPARRRARMPSGHVNDDRGAGAQVARTRRVTMRRSSGTTGSGRWGQRGVSRRLFLRGTALTTFGLAGAALIGCEDDEEPEGNGGNGSSEGTPSGGATTPSGAPSPAGTAGGAPPAAGGEIGTADVVGIWGEEVPNFEAMVEPWSEDTGGDVEFTGTRELAALLTTRVEGNNPPDIALPAEVGLFQQFATEGLLVPLSDCGVDQVVMD